MALSDNDFPKFERGVSDPEKVFNQDAFILDRVEAVEIAVCMMKVALEGIMEGLENAVVISVGRKSKDDDESGPSMPIMEV